jgi:uncharacterized CHY-type Zn-finger protein
MFLIAGVSPKTTILDDKPQLCPICGLARARYRRVDHYFSLFFIPLLKVKKGEAFLMCDKCEKEVNEFGYAHGVSHGEREVVCDACGKKMKEDFIFCPYCGGARCKN